MLIAGSPTASKLSRPGSPLKQTDMSTIYRRTRPKMFYPRRQIKCSVVLSLVLLHELTHYPHQVTYIMFN